MRSLHGLSLMAVDFFGQLCKTETTRFWTSGAYRRSLTANWPLSVYYAVYTTPPSDRERYLCGAGPSSCPCSTLCGSVGASALKQSYGTDLWPDEGPIRDNADNIEVESGYSFVQVSSKPFTLTKIDASIRRSNAPSVRIVFCLDNKRPAMINVAYLF